jgi:predicted acetyltransferase
MMRQVTLSRINNQSLFHCLLNHFNMMRQVTLSRIDNQSLFHCLLNHFNMMHQVTLSRINNQSLFHCLLNHFNMMFLRCDLIYRVECVLDPQCLITPYRVLHAGVHIPSIQRSIQRQMFTFFNRRVVSPLS